MPPLQSAAPSIGWSCPDFRLPGVNGQTYARDDFASAPILVVMFICNHCPYVLAVEDRLIALNREFGPQGVQFVGICSNDASHYPDDAFDKLAQRWRTKEYGFPYLHDESQAVARSFEAVCTPDIYVFDEKRTLAYRGRIDDNWKDPAQVTRRELATALQALIDGRRPDGKAIATIGCGIKWRS